MICALYFISLLIVKPKTVALQNHTINKQCVSVSEFCMGLVNYFTDDFYDF
jgi:hypothetical protein